MSRIRDVVQLEIALVVLSLAFFAWLGYMLFLRRVSAERHRIFRNLFKDLFFYLLTGGLFFTSYWLMEQNPPSDNSVIKLIPYLGLVTLFLGAICIVKIFKILAFEYLFINHMNVGVPLLIVNLFTLFISVLIAGWIATAIFGVQVTPLLATSAAFSIILGLALQDTLGNLFAGVSLQFDKPFEIGDWVEVGLSGQKIVGRVHEITWRATLLVSFTDETIILPNRLMSQAEISNFSCKDRPFCKTVNFYVEYQTSFDRAERAILSAIKDIEEVCASPAPIVLLRDAGDSYMTLRLVFSLNDYGSQYLVMSEIYKKALHSLEKEGIRIAPPKIKVLKESA